MPSLTSYEPQSVEIEAIETEAIEPEDFEPRRIELGRNLGTDPYLNTGKIYEKLYHWRYGRIWKNGAEMSYLQSQMHSDYDSGESIADSDLEGGEQRKMLASPLYMQSREDCEPSRMPIAQKKLAALSQERGASAKRTQADRSRRESLMSSSSQEPSAPEKPAAMFSSGNENLEINSRVPFSKTLTRQIWEDLFLEVIKIIYSVRQEMNLWDKEHQVRSLNNCISELQQQAHAQRLELQDAQHGFFFESRREQVRVQELSMKEKVLPDTQIRSMHEMGEMQRAHEQRIDEVSVQKWRGNHETTQKLTSQLQQMQEQINSMTDSGDFQGV